MTTLSTAQNPETTPEAAAEAELQRRTDALFDEMAQTARERCAHLFTDESEEG